MRRAVAAGCVVVADHDADRGGGAIPAGLADRGGLHVPILGAAVARRVAAVPVPVPDDGRDRRRLAVLGVGERVGAVAVRPDVDADRGCLAAAGAGGGGIAAAAGLGGGDVVLHAVVGEVHADGDRVAAAIRARPGV